MAIAPNPARMAEYETKLATLVETRAVHMEVNNDHKVKNLNRQIQTQLRWIVAAHAAAEAAARDAA